MPLTITDNGQGNRVSIPPEAVQQMQGAVTLSGANTVLEIGEGCRCLSLRIELGSDVHVFVGRDCSLGHLEIYAIRGARISVGDRCRMNGLVRLMAHEKASLTLGADCLLSGFVDVTVSDMHSIVDVATGARVNPARDVTIGEHVWVGQHTQILKGARIGADSVIGAGSVVAGDIPANTVAAGTPARVIRSGVTWRGNLM